MTEGLLARKGEANPATTHHGGESRFQARRVVVLPPIALHRAPDPGQRVPPRRAANVAQPCRAQVARRKFTFRIEPERHQNFCAVADELGISRQELLTRALDAYLHTRRGDLSGSPLRSEGFTPYDASRPSDNGAPLQLPFQGIS